MESLRRIAPGAYVIAALLFLITLVDYLGNAWPFRLGDVNWRYGVMGMVSTYLLSPLLGCLIASATAAWLQQPRVSRILGVFMWVGAALMLTALISFLLNSIQVRGATAPEARWVTTTSFLIASAKMLSAAVGLIVLGLGNLQVAAAAAEAEASAPTKRVSTRPLITNL